MIVRMTWGLAWLAAAGAIDERPHDGNASFAAVLGEGLEAGGRAIRLPPPTFADGQTAAQQRDALRELAGSDRAVEGLLRPSVTAPFLLTLRDERADGATIRAGDLVFAARLDLDAIDPDALFGRPGGGPIEAGNMRFEAQVLDDDEGGEAPDGSRLVHSTGRLLDRIGVESTARVEASRSAESLVVASRTDRRFDDHERWPNRWWPIERRGASESAGPPRPYDGGIGYAKLTRLKDDPAAVIVELHFAFVEPTAWFDGAPILRSKFGLIAQDQIRRLRRELARPVAGP